MATVENSASVDIGGNTTTVTFSGFAVGVGERVVVMANAANGRAVSTLDFGTDTGVGTQVSALDNPGLGQVEIWEITGIDGTEDLVINFDGNARNAGAVVSVSSAAAVSDATSRQSEADGTPGTSSLTVSNAASGDIIVDAFRKTGLAPTVGADQTQVGAGSGGGIAGGQSHQLGSVDGVMTWSWSGPDPQTVHIAARIPDDSGPGEHNATGLLGEVEIEGFSAASITTDRHPVGSLGEVNVEGFAATIELQRTPRGSLGEVNVEGFIASIDSALLIEVTSALGEVNFEGFIATPTIIFEPTFFPILGEVNIEGFIATPEIVYEPTFFSSLGEVNFEGFIPTIDITYEPEFEPAVGEVNVEGFIATPTIIYEPEFEPAFGEVNVEGFIASITVIYEPTVFGALGEVNFEGFIAAVTAEGEFQALPDVGEVNFEGFIAVVTLETVGEHDADGLLGEVNVEGFAATVTIERTQSPQLGEVNVEGFAGSVDQVRTQRPQLGVVNFDGSIATVTTTAPAVEITADALSGEAEVIGFPATVTGPPVVSVEQDRGAGSGRWDDTLSQMRKEDDELLMFIKEFMERVA